MTVARTMTLRGIITCADGNRSPPIQVLDYVSPDRTRGWRIKDAWLWCQTIRASTPNDAHGMMVIQAQLSTQEVKPVFDQYVDDNRLFGWMQQHYLRRTTSGGSSTDYILPNAGLNDRCRFIIDEDTTVVKELWLGMASSSDGSDEPEREWNFLIDLEEIKVSPEQSVFQQLKGMGQDVSN